MIEDNKGNLWIIAENALACFHPEKETFEHYDKKYLQQDLYFTEAAPVQNQHHQLLLGTDIGILRIFPEQLQKVAMFLLSYSPDSRYKELPRIWILMT